MAQRHIGTLLDRKAINDINDNFTELYDEYIGAGMDAAEAREKAEQAVADALFAKSTAVEAKDTADLTREEMIAIIREQTEGGDLVPEITQARGGQATLGERLNSVDSQLAQIENLENYELNSKGRKKRGLVVFISDDGHRGDWETLRPIFESSGVPFCSAIVTEWMNDVTHPNHPSRMTWDQLRYLQDEMGCEIMSHSVTHNRPTFITDRTEAGVREEYRESKNELIRRGFDVQSYRVPGNVYGTRERVIAKEYYRAMVVSQYGEDGLNHTPLEQYELKSIWLDNESYGGAKDFNYYKEHIDRANEEGALLIISTHGYALSGVESLMEQVVQYASTNSKVVTLRDALNEIGNIVDVGDYTKTSSGARAQRGNHYVIGADGTISGSTTVTERNRFTAQSTYYDFPFGETITPVYSLYAEGMPGGRSGKLFNYRIDDNEHGMNFQKFIPFNSEDVYFRNLRSDFTFSGWVILNSITYPRNNSFDTTTPFSAFERGITYSKITSSNPNVSNTPSGDPGLLITTKADFTEYSPGFSFQEFRPFRSNVSYTRYVVDENNFSDWVSNKTVRLPHENSYNGLTPVSQFPLGITYSTFTTAQASNVGLPNNQPGTLETHKVTHSTSYGFNYQMFHAYNSASGRAYKRYATGESTWGEWALVMGTE